MAVPAGLHLPFGISEQPIWWTLWSGSQAPLTYCPLSKQAMAAEALSPDHELAVSFC